MKTTYTLEAGRSILRDGSPFVRVQKWDRTSAVEADDFAKEIVRAVNSHDELLGLLKTARGWSTGESFNRAADNAIAKAEGK